MKILAIERECPRVKDKAFTSELSKAEAQRVWELQQEGILREIYFRANRNEAVLMLECESIKLAKSILDNMPLVEAGLITFELIPLKPYPGLARLFADD